MKSTWTHHLEKDVLPWWNTRAADTQHGGVFTNFDNNGELLSMNKYTWSQGRWAWLAAELSEEIASGNIADADADAEQWARRAKCTAQFLFDHALLGDGRTAYLTSREGTPIPQEPAGEVATSVFADLFAALGLGAAARISPQNSQEWLDAAGTILHRAERDWIARSCLSEPYPVPAGFRDLAGPMNLLHTAAEMLRARQVCPMTPGFWDSVAAVRDRAFDLLLGDEGFLGEETWWEFYPASSDLSGTLLGEHRTPGHLLEALWMIAHALEQAGETPPWEHFGQLGERAFAIGWDDADSGMFRYVHLAGGQPHGRLLDAQAPTPYEALLTQTWDTKLWWVHSEAVYAAAMLAEHVPGMEPWCERVSEYTFSTFPDQVHGEWAQIRERDGTPLNKVVALPVKDPFHIIRSLIFLSRIERRS